MGTESAMRPGPVLIQAFSSTTPSMRGTLAPKTVEIRGSNPCSEYMFLDDTACNLASMNLLTFLKDGEFQAEDYVHATRLWTITLEISVMMAQFPSKEIAQLSYDFRTLRSGLREYRRPLDEHGL